MASTVGWRLALLALALNTLCHAQSGRELRFNLSSDPKTFDPMLVADDASETIRYLTAGVLVRMDRQTQRLEPELATSWKISNAGKSISFQLREGIRFSDGTAFSATDVAFTLQRLMDPALHSPTGDSFRSAPGAVRSEVSGNNRITITFPAAVAGLAGLFDQVAIMSGTSPKREMAVLGPFYVAEYKPGDFVFLKPNSNFWKSGNGGQVSPHLRGIRMEIQPNRDIEFLKFTRGDLDLINSLDSNYYDRLEKSKPATVHDAGPSLDSDLMWFNQVSTAPIETYKRGWFQSVNFRRAISAAMNREDMCRIIFNGHARPAIGPVSPANKFWFDGKLRPQQYDPQAAMKLLESEGFRLKDGRLFDAQGHPVEFSLATNAGNRYRERMTAMIQEDLGKIGIKVSVASLDFPSLIERMTRTFDYEAILLGFVNDDLDPNNQMNVWLSASENHQWNPSEKTPATAWEAEIDRLMRAQASSLNPGRRKEYFDRVQEIVVEEVPFIYLINKNALSAISTELTGVEPVVLRPQTYWNIEEIGKK